MSVLLVLIDTGTLLPTPLSPDHPKIPGQSPGGDQAAKADSRTQKPGDPDKVQSPMLTFLLNPLCQNTIGQHGSSPHCLLLCVPIL